MFSVGGNGRFSMSSSNGSSRVVRESKGSNGKEEQIAKKESEQKSHKFSK